MREDQRAALPEILVPAGVVEMPMRVDDVLDRPGAQRLDRGDDLVGQRSELVVDQHRAVRAVADADVAALAEQHGDAGLELLRADLDGLEILRRAGRRNERQQRRDEDCKSDHVRSPPR